MAPRFGRLGWRHPRPNDYQGPDSRPLRDTFAALQQSMTWPHFGADIDVQAIGAAFTKKTITAYDDPYSLIRANDNIQAPRDFQTWMFLGVANIIASPAGPARGLLSWFIDGVEHYGDENYIPAGAGDLRLSAVALAPVQQNSIIDIRAFSSVADNIDAGRCWGVFFPMTS